MKRFLIFALALTMIFSVCAPAVLAAPDDASLPDVIQVDEHATDPNPNGSDPTVNVIAGDGVTAEITPETQEDAPTEQDSGSRFGTQKNIIFGGVCVLIMVAVYVLLRIKMKRA